MASPRVLIVDNDREMPALLAESRRDGRLGQRARPGRHAALAAALIAVPMALSPAEAATAGQAGQGGVGPILFALAVLVLCAKAGGLAAQALGQPAVLGELLVGITLANLVPPLLGADPIAFVRGERTIAVLAEVGVLILLFDVGLEADLRALLRAGWTSLLVAVVGIVAPMGLGWAVAAWLLPAAPAISHVFIGATLSATSVGITARVLKDLGVTQSREAQIILGAAVIDDVLGLVVLAAVTGVVGAATTGGGISVFGVLAILLKALLFLGITVGVGHRLSGPIVRLAARTGQRGILLVFGLSLCFIFAFLAERIGLADIVGAFAAGLMLDPYGHGVRAREEEATLSELMHPLSSLFVPLFFVLMGLGVDLASLARPASLAVGGSLVVVAILGKQACSLVLFDRSVRRLAVGIGMIPRGEVGLIFAGIGAGLTLQGQPLLGPGVFSAIVLMVLVTTLLAPVGLRWAFTGRGRGGHAD